MEVASVGPQRETNYVSLPNGAVIPIKRDGEVEPLVQESYTKGLDENSKKEFLPSIKDPRIKKFLESGYPSALGNSWQVTTVIVSANSSEAIMKSYLPHDTKYPKYQQLCIFHGSNSDVFIKLFTVDRNFTQDIRAKLNPNRTINEKSIQEDLYVLNPNVVKPNLS